MSRAPDRRPPPQPMLPQAPSTTAAPDPEAAPEPKPSPAAPDPPQQAPVPASSPAAPAAPQQRQAPRPAEPRRVVPDGRMMLPSQRPKATEVREKNYRFFLVGEPGIGKSTFGVQSDNPVFLPAELSPNVPDDLCFPRPESWEDLFVALRQLYAGEHEYKTLVLDTADAATALCAVAVLAKAPTGAGTKGGANYLSDVGGGFRDAGDAALDEEWTRLLASLDRLIEKRNMNVVILGHSKLGKYKNPEAGGADFDMWIPSVPERVAQRIRGWSDIVGMAKKEIRTGRDGKGGKGRAKAIAIGEAHMLHVRAMPVAPWIKNRFDLPASMPLDFETFAGYMRARRTPAEVSSMMEVIMEKATQLRGHKFLDRSGGEVEYEAWVGERLKRPMNVGELVQLDSKLQAKINELFPQDDGDGDDQQGEGKPEGTGQ